MNDFFSTYHFSWTNWLLTAVGLLLLYFVLQFSRRLLENFAPKNRFFNGFQHGLTTVLTVYEPLALMVLGIVFLFIRPFSHGIILLFLVVACFRYIRDYLSGWLVRVDDVINEGVRLKIKNHQGVVTKLGNLGLFLQTTEGLHRIGYTQLLADGFTVISGEEIKGLCHLMIQPTENNTTKRPLIHLKDLLATTPYLDWKQPPELKLISEEDSPKIKANLLLREDKHLQDLKLLLKQWGYKTVSSEQ